jgi:hypothetical protein
MDDPILSWLPLDQWGAVSGSGPRFTSVDPRLSDKDCYVLAQERTEFLDRSEFDDADLRKIFTLNYRACVKAKN